MTYDIEFRPVALRDIEKLDRVVARRVVEKVDAMRSDLVCGTVVRYMIDGEDTSLLSFTRRSCGRTERNSSSFYPTTDSEDELLV